MTRGLVFDPVRALAAWGRVASSLTATALAASVVIPARLQLMGLAMMAPSPGRASEMWRMIGEKSEAATTGGLAAARAAQRGAGLAQVTLAAIAPAKRTARANAKRLKGR